MDLDQTGNVSWLTQQRDQLSFPAAFVAECFNAFHVMAYNSSGARMWPEKTANGFHWKQFALLEFSLPRLNRQQP